MNDKPMDAPKTAVKSTEAELRETAVAFADVMQRAQDEGLTFAWPVNSTAMRELAISQGAPPAATKKVK